MPSDRVDSPGNDGPAAVATQPRPHGRRLATSAAFFSFATGLSRVAGLGREVVVARYFGVGGPMAAFSIAFQAPNLIRALFADSALQGAFVPVFTELLEKGQRREAFRVASGLLFVICLVLGVLTALFVLIAPVLIPPLTGPKFTPALDELTVGLSQLMFPIVLLLGISGLTVGMLNSFEHFSVPALAPLAWNLVIIGAVVGLVPVLPEDDQIYAYAIGVLAGSVVQLLLPLPWLRGRGGHLGLSFDFRNPHVIRVLKLMLPVTLALGLINFGFAIDQLIGTLVQKEAPAAIEKAFRIYQLPQGLFSIAIATVLFPTLSRLAARHERDQLRRTLATGARQILLLLIPSAALMAVLAEPITRLLYQRGAFDPAATELVADATFWWALALPAQGVSLLLTRTYFSLQRTRITTVLAAGNLAINTIVALALYAPFGIAGIVIGTVAGTLAMTTAQALLLRPDLGGIDGRGTVTASLRMLAAAVPLAVVSYTTWRELDQLLGRSLPAQTLTLAAAIAAGAATYAALAWALGIPETRQIRDLLTRGVRRR